MDMPVGDGTIINQRNNSMTHVRPYNLSHVDGRRKRVVARSQEDAIRFAEREWTASAASAMDMATDPMPIEYARPDYQPLPAGTPTRDALVMPGEAQAGTEAGE